jgi:Holliday junction resolvase-like predicted endonuclease
VVRNWRSRTGEIDLVVRRGDLLVICEVKTRGSDRFGSPLEAVTPLKARRIRRVTSEWLASARSSGEILREGVAGRPPSNRSGVDIRFDVASVTTNGRQLVIEVTEGAFE